MLRGVQHAGGQRQGGQVRGQCGHAERWSTPRWTACCMCIAEQREVHDAENSILQRNRNMHALCECGRGTCRMIMMSSLLLLSSAVFSFNIFFFPGNLPIVGIPSMLCMCWHAVRVLAACDHSHASPSAYCTHTVPSTSATPQPTLQYYCHCIRPHSHYT